MSRLTNFSPNGANLMVKTGKLSLELLLILQNYFKVIKSQCFIFSKMMNLLSPVSAVKHLLLFLLLLSP